MKLRKKFQTKIKRLLNQKGQGIVEYVLLLAVMSSITLLFVGFMNKNLSRYWEHAVNLVINDKPGTKTLSFD